MKKEEIALSELKLVGISVRTNNARNIQADLSLNEISSTAQRYFLNGLSEKIKRRKAAGTTFCVYTNYESDAGGDYTYFIGEEVTSFEEVDSELETLTIPIQLYAKFTSDIGKMPYVCIDMWEKIWKMKPDDFGGQRAYIADFEVYDHRSVNPEQAVLDIYIGIRK